MTTFYSINEEDFCYQHPADAIADLLDEPKVGDVIWQSEFEMLSAEDFKSLPYIVGDCIYDQIYDLVGESAEDYDIPENKLIELKSFIDKWLSEGMEFEKYFTSVGPMTEYKITQEDIYDARGD